MSQDCAPDNSSCSTLPDYGKDKKRSRGPAQLLTVIRHGKRLDEVEELWRHAAVRPWDPPLWCDGLASIKDKAADLLRFKFQRMVVSPFQRCLETAKLLNMVLDLPLSHLQVDRAVCEVLDPKILVGAQLSPPTGIAADWMWGSGSLDSTLQAMFGSEASQISIAAGTFPDFPETIESAHERYTTAFEDISLRFPGENVLVVSHGEAVGSAVSSMLPQVLVYEVLHCGFASMYRKQRSSGRWGSWRLKESDCEGVNWTV